MTWDAPDLTPSARALRLLDAAAPLGRGALKVLAQRVGALDNPELREALVRAAARRGVDLPDDAGSWSLKRLLRVARGREAGARVRTNPVMRDEPFTCVHCGHAARPHGRTARDHCPACLRSVHVDVVPGDRAAGCGGVLDPVGAVVRGDEVLLEYRCRRCGETRRNRALLDGDDPDRWEVVVALTAVEP